VTTSPYTNEYEIRIFGLKHGGQHAIINWIASLFREPVHFFNNCGWSCDPYRTGRTRGHRWGTPIEDIFVYLEKMKKASEQEVNGIKYKPKKCLMYSYENAIVDYVYDDVKPATPKGIVGTSKHVFDVLILRDIFNLAASRFVNKGTDYGPKYYKKHYNDLGDDFLAFDRKDYFFRDERFRIPYRAAAFEFLGDTDYLRNKVLISFNDWFLSKGYREHTASKFGLPNNEVSVSVVAGVGGRGSRWDNFDYNGKAQEMRILERWKNFEDNKLFWDVLKSWEEEVAMSNDIFGEIPGTMEYVRGV
jgi:hypothetical protein